MNVKGTIKLINETQTFPSGFEKREFVVTTQEQYPQDIKIEMIKDKCSILDKYKAGDSVEVGINLRGNEYEGKYYVNIQGWKISSEESGSKPEFQAEGTEGGGDVEHNDDLPF